MCLYDLVDIQEFYVHTLGDEYKPGYQKAAETLQLANQWEGPKAPIPVAASQQEDNTKATVWHYGIFSLLKLQFVLIMKCIAISYKFLQRRQWEFDNTIQCFLGGRLYKFIYP